jgi:hypothetical protein
MNRSLNIINKEFKAYAVADKRVNGYFWGDFIEAINSAEPAHYPLMLVTPQPGNVGEKFVTYSFIVSLFDKYEQGSQRQLQEVHSDMHRIGVDLIRVIKNSYRWNSYAEIQVTVNSNPFIERGQDFTAGWYFNLSLKVYENEDICEVPLTDYDLQAEGHFGVTCDPATVRNSDDSFVELVASGGELELEDYEVEIQDSDGNIVCVRVFPAMQDITIDLTDICQE